MLHGTLVVASHIEYISDLDLMLQLRSTLYNIWNKWVQNCKLHTSLFMGRQVQLTSLPVCDPICRGYYEVWGKHTYKDTHSSVISPGLLPWSAPNPLHSCWILGYSCVQRSPCLHHTPTHPTVPQLKHFLGSSAAIQSSAVSGYLYIPDEMEMAVQCITQCMALWLFNMWYVFNGSIKFVI